MKRGAQLKLSFGMIFSIILIIVFIAFAFFAIKKFLGIKNEIQIRQFLDDLQKDVDKIWKGSQGSQEVEYILPSKIDAVCFTNDDYENLFFRSKGYVRGKKIDHIDIEKITEEGDFCIEKVNSKVKILIKMNYGEKLVTITK